MFLIFFFFKQKTAYEMRISDWSSDVCSSDLLFERGIDLAPARRLLERRGRARAVAHVGDGDLHGIFVYLDVVMSEDFGANHGIQIGRAQCREECVSTCRSRWSPDH